MRISCPDCSTEFDVPDAALAGRSRKLRCDLCGHAWRHTAATPEETPEETGDNAVDNSVDNIMDKGVKLALQAASWPVDRGEAFATDTFANDPATDAPDDIHAAAQRLFGQPVDEMARAEVAEAVAHEEDHELPLFLTVGLGGEVVSDAGSSDSASGSARAEGDRFADLIYGARNHAVEYEPEAERRSAKAESVRIRPLLVILLVVAVVALALGQHRLVIHFLPASASFFQGLGLK